MLLNCSVWKVRKIDIIKLKRTNLSKNYYSIDLNNQPHKFRMSFEEIDTLETKGKVDIERMGNPITLELVDF